MVYKKQLNPNGKYKDSEENVWEILSCERTEEKRFREIGTVQREIAPGEFVDEPIIEGYIVVNEGWDEFPSIEAAAEAYGLIYGPLQIEGKLDNNETVK